MKRINEYFKSFFEKEESLESYNFEKFERVVSNKLKPNEVAIYKNNVIQLSKDLSDLVRVSGFRYVELLYDKEVKKIALRCLVDQTMDSFSMKLKSGKDTVEITAISFLKHIGVSGKKFRIEMTPYYGMLVSSSIPDHVFEKDVETGIKPRVKKANKSRSTKNLEGIRFDTSDIAFDYGDIVYSIKRGNNEQGKIIGFRDTEYGVTARIKLNNGRVRNILIKNIRKLSKVGVVDYSNKGSLEVSGNE